jgi:hypothetical protein
MNKISSYVFVFRRIFLGIFTVSWFDSKRGPENEGFHGSIFNLNFQRDKIYFLQFQVQPKLPKMTKYRSDFYMR